MVYHQSTTAPADPTPRCDCAPTAHGCPICCGCPRCRALEARYVALERQAYMATYDGGAS